MDMQPPLPVTTQPQPDCHCDYLPKSPPYRMHCTCVWRAEGHLDAMKLLLKKGADPEATTRGDHDPLEPAVCTGCGACSSLTGGWPHPTPRAGMATPLHVAASVGRIEAVRLLTGPAHRVELLAKDATGATARQVANHTGHLDVVEALDGALTDYVTAMYLPLSCAVCPRVCVVGRLCSMQQVQTAAWWLTTSQIC
jgi:hypothetical protein